MKYLLMNPKNRPRGINKKIKEELLKYINEEVRKNHFPSRRELERDFKIKLESYFKDIKTLYNKSGNRYKLHSNQNIKQIKAKLLQKIIIKNLKKFNLELISSRGVHERGIDLLTKRGKKS